MFTILVQTFAVRSLSSSAECNTPKLRKRRGGRENFAQPPLPPPLLFSSVLRSSLSGDDAPKGAGDRKRAMALGICRLSDFEGPANYAVSDSH